MDLMDYQSAFCEVDKYSRVAHPQLNNLSKTEAREDKGDLLVNSRRSAPSAEAGVSEPVVD
jgi:hypothetical protein